MRNNGIQAFRYQAFRFRYHLRIFSKNIFTTVLHIQYKVLSLMYQKQ